LNESTASFTGLVDLAAQDLGGRAVGTNDDFFAGVENLLLPGRGVFIADKFTERGKWMDGWESRRKRGPGHDFCIIELGAAGTLRGFDVDTHHFNGNHPPFAMIEGLVAPRGTAFDDLNRRDWTELLAQVPLRPDSQNLFAAIPSGPVTHLRLSIFPDGGVARFRAYGSVTPDFERTVIDDVSRPHVATGLVDLAAVQNGGIALACSDARFGPMNNLLLPGRAENMGGGWETRRSRSGGNDWILVKLAARGTARTVEIDTNHFKGNYPDRCSIDGIDAASARITELIASQKWATLLPESKLEAHTRHFFSRELETLPSLTHVRLNVFPDGGVSRLRVWGSPDA
jgi:allantoicase